ncbi:hypothetical protein [Neobacillus sp. DY30]|uniref:hypothetical protein n=1 Tax=Neobacillus sp. DY30 TaxID=3047871 RepID=UPI0024C09021|nr:hypothetical protein [Neobacillus sp. DY30]WHX98750.1 hypothetical protein QNH29_19325 [Neobacillus sp. DY30]
MKRCFLILFTAAFIFSFNVTVLADEGHEEDIKKAAENIKNKTNNEHSEESNSHSVGANTYSEEADAPSDAANAHGEEEAHGKEADTHSEKEGAHGEESVADDHHGPVVETPPNYKVLGSYGAVNLSFILIEVWNKWFRRKGTAGNQPAYS